ncbi:phosphoribosylformylglycinamidine cyclo-ligase [Bacillus shivajii]|uniref:phosphoribosylformylglycinamidine cyclo-ligase n=1 Tax=Bacillus shivajii TaxID=1983719 RepID=UPI001CFBB162|nr:phosphoribosylformylglycinamidine cyclo-ligase [Bacillus shivajii]UCZ53792.1 phosphoribosylformylglycinamidine cyclo-ligase [Bacillus shivajii]
MSKAYEAAGVNIEAGYEGVRRIQKHAESTKQPGVMGALGSFGGLFDLSAFSYKEPVLVSGTDGVGTKLLIAQEMKKYDTIGIDAVAMCVNDVIAQGAKPLFFLDYLALGKNDPTIVEQIVSGIAEGCSQSQCALIGGETAEMPDLYDDNEYDVAGFTVGIAEKESLINSTSITAGDVVIGLPSSGIHSNGFSLVRKIVKDEGLSWNDSFDSSGKTIGDVCLTPTKIYVQALLPLFEEKILKGAAHITGGGFYENIPRMLPDHLGADIDLDAWEVPAIFEWLKEKGKLSNEDLFTTFNMGIGFVVTVKKDDVDQACKMLMEAGESPIVLGTVTDEKGVSLKGELQ